ncbi:NifU family protein [Mycobacterium sp. NPDC003449]
MSRSSKTSDIRSAVEEAITLHLGRFLDSHGGAVGAASVSPDGDVVLEFEGACRGCPAVAATFYSKVAPLLRRVDGVRSVSAPNVNVSEAAVRRLLTVSGPSGQPGTRTSPRADRGSHATPLPIPVGNQRPEGDRTR